MKKWVINLMKQLDVATPQTTSDTQVPAEIQHISEEKATLLFIIDNYNKHLFEVEKHSVRKVREKLDTMAKDLLDPCPDKTERTLFDIRQFFSSYRIDEHSYIQNTFDDFKRIIWDFADHLSEDLRFDNSKEKRLAIYLHELREAVEANSIESLRSKSREFINAYIEYQTQKNELRDKRIESTKKSLDAVKNQLMEATHNLNIDHLTLAHNRKSFDEYMQKINQQCQELGGTASLIILDIDFFKKINDSYGHDTGDFVLKECVRTLKEVFTSDDEMVARIGGEEFAIVLPQHNVAAASLRAEEALQRIRLQILNCGDATITYTASMGIAQLLNNEDVSSWLKRTDTALYKSKNGGRNRYTLATEESPIYSVA